MNAALFPLAVAPPSPYPPYLPVGLLVQHHPNPCPAAKDGRGYVWRHDTTVASLVGDLTLVEYGAYLYTSAGWRLRASMRRGRVYADLDDARRDAQPLPGDAMGYFLARVARGRLFKGYAIVETEGERDARPPSARNCGRRRKNLYPHGGGLTIRTRDDPPHGESRKDKVTMPNIKRLLLAAALLAPTSLLALRQTQWLPLNATPAMGHASSPASQEVTKNTATYSIAASVTDLDTFQKNTDLQQTAQLAGNEGDVSIQTNMSSPLAVNRSFDPTSGKREATYVCKGSPYLLDHGDVAFVVYTFKGVDNMSGARQDVDTASSQSVVAFKYVSPPPPPGP